MYNVTINYVNIYIYIFMIYNELYIINLTLNLAK